MSHPSRKILIVAALHRHAYFGDICQGLANARMEHPEVSILVTQKITTPGLHHLKADAVIAQLSSHRQLETWPQFKGPILNVSNRLLLPDIPTLATDDYRVGEVAAEHLLSKGLKHFGVLTDKVARYAALRKEGFSTTIRQAGGSISSFIQEEGDPFPDYQPSPELQAWIRTLSRPCGILCADDIMARKLVEWLVDQGLAPPSDFCVVGVNNDPITCDLSPVPISSVSLNGQAVGEKALEVILQTLSQGHFPESLPLIPPRGVHMRKSSDIYVSYDDLIAKAVSYINTHLHRELTVEELSRSQHVSRRVLERRFQSALGHAPYEEITRLRIQKAKQLLQDRRDLTIGKIAELCGFQQENSFYYQFRRHENCTPGQWKMRHHPGRG